MSFPTTYSKLALAVANGNTTGTLLSGYVAETGDVNTAVTAHTSAGDRCQLDGAGGIWFASAGGNGYGQYTFNNKPASQDASFQFAIHFFDTTNRNSVVGVVCRSAQGSNTGYIFKWNGYTGNSQFDICLNNATGNGTALAVYAFTPTIGQTVLCRAGWKGNLLTLCIDIQDGNGMRLVAAVRDSTYTGYETSGGYVGVGVGAYTSISSSQGPHLQGPLLFDSTQQNNQVQNSFNPALPINKNLSYVRLHEDWREVLATEDGSTPANRTIGVDAWVIGDNGGYNVQGSAAAYNDYTYLTLQPGRFEGGFNLPDSRQNACLWYPSDGLIDLHNFNFTVNIGVFLTEVAIANGTGGTFTLSLCVYPDPTTMATDLAGSRNGTGGHVYTTAAITFATAGSTINSVAYSAYQMTGINIQNAIQALGGIWANAKVVGPGIYNGYYFNIVVCGNPVFNLVNLVSSVSSVTGSSVAMYGTRQTLLQYINGEGSSWSFGTGASVTFFSLGHGNHVFSAMQNSNGLVFHLYDNLGSGAAYTKSYYISFAYGTPAYAFGAADNWFALTFSYYNGEVRIYFDGYWIPFATSGYPGGSSAGPRWTDVPVTGLSAFANGCNRTQDGIAFGSNYGVNNSLVQYQPAALTFGDMYVMPANFQGSTITPGAVLPADAPVALTVNTAGTTIGTVNGSLGGSVSSPIATTAATAMAAVNKTGSVVRYGIKLNLLKVDTTLAHAQPSYLNGSYTSQFVAAGFSDDAVAGAGGTLYYGYVSVIYAEIDRICQGGAALQINLSYNNLYTGGSSSYTSDLTICQYAANGHAHYPLNDHNGPDITWPNSQANYITICTDVYQIVKAYCISKGYTLDPLVTFGNEYPSYTTGTESQINSMYAAMSAAFKAIGVTKFGTEGWTTVLTDTTSSGLIQVVQAYNTGHSGATALFTDVTLHDYSGNLAQVLYEIQQMQNVLTTTLWVTNSISMSLGEINIPSNYSANGSSPALPVAPWNSTTLPMTAQNARAGAWYAASLITMQAFNAIVGSTLSAVLPSISSISARKTTFTTFASGSTDQFVATLGQYDETTSNYGIGSTIAAMWNKIQGMSVKYCALNPVSPGVYVLVAVDGSGGTWVFMSYFVQDKNRKTTKLALTLSGVAAGTLGQCWVAGWDGQQYRSDYADSQASAHQFMEVAQLAGGVDANSLLTVNLPPQCTLLVEIKSPGPATTDVRNGTSYNFGGSTGSLAVPAANKVLTGTAVDNTTGTLTLAAAGNVLTGTGTFGVGGTSVTPTLTLPSANNVFTGAGAFGVGGTSSTPTLTLPSAGNVLSSNGAFGVGGTSVTPTLTLPGAGNVLTGTGTFGVSGTGSTPTLTLPAANKVLSSVGTYGVGGTGFTATLTLPSVTDVLTGSGLFGIGGNGSTPSLTIPSAGNVLSSAGTYGVAGTGTTPTLTLPSAGNVLSSNGAFGVGGTGSTPTLILPGAGNVLTGTSYGVGGNGSSGTLTLPPPTNVYSYSYGVTGSLLTGTLVLPATSDVSYNTAYGTPGSFMYGTSQLPAAQYVLSGQNFGPGGGTGGTLTLPSQSNVRTAVTYGVVGSISTGTMDLPNQRYVLTGISYDNGSSNGTLTLPVAGNVAGGVTFGVNNALTTGSLVLPPAGHVWTGDSGYGNPASLTDGTLVLPAASTVLTGTVYGVSGNSLSGDVDLPPTNRVYVGLTYGPNDSLTGSMEVVNYHTPPPPTLLAPSSLTFSGEGNSGQIFVVTRPIRITLVRKADEQLFYTLDGSDPANSPTRQAYTVAFTIVSALMLRYVGISTGQTTILFVL